MTVLRAVVALMLTGSAGLPYAAPVACAIFRSEMIAMKGSIATNDRPHLTDVAAGDACDFAECATATVAPVATLTVSDAVVPVADVALHFPTVAPDVDPTPPLTPPPKA